MPKAYIYDLTDTWDAAGTTFNAIRMNVTDTASAAGSLLMDLQVGGASRFSVRKDGLISTAAKAYFAGATVTLGETGSGEVTVRSAGGFGFSPDTTGLSTPDLILRRDAANTLAQRNGTNAQTFRLYETFTDASNYSRLAFTHSGGNFQIKQEHAGTGTVRELQMGVSNGVQWKIINGGHFLAGTDNTYDIGASGANRPRDVYVARSITAASGTLTASTPNLVLSQTWNNAAASFDVMNISVTNTASNDGRLINCLVGGNSVFTVDRDGAVSASGQFLVAAGGQVRWLTRARIYAPADGVFQLTNNAAADFNRLQFGGTTSSFPALKRNSTALETKLADDSAYAPHAMQYLDVTDGVTAPAAATGRARIYVDTADGDLKIIFADGTIKTIVTDT